MAGMQPGMILAESWRRRCPMMVSELKITRSWGMHQFARLMSEGLTHSRGHV